MISERVSSGVAVGRVSNKSRAAKGFKPITNIQYATPAVKFREVRGRLSTIAFFLGMSIITASILLGRAHALYIVVLVSSILMTLLWKKTPRPWIYLVSISAATPIAMFRQQVACNLIFAFWFMVFNIRYLSKLPKWIYVPAALAVFGVLTSSFNWMSDSVVKNIMRQGAFAYNFFLAPFLLLPMVYLRMGESRDHAANLKGLLFCLIVPSTLILLTAKLLGTQANVWQASLHAESLSEGYIQYKLGRVVVNLTRTQVGFILAALICASTAIAVSQVRPRYRLMAGACLLSNAAFLVTTGSFGSGFACLCGLAALFYGQFRTVNVARVLISVAVIAFMLSLTYGLSPPSVKEYLGKRYEHRVSAADDDRLVLWGRAINYFLQHPGGVGLTLTVGDRIKTNPHNDYIAYAVSYGVTGGLAYPFLVTGLLVYFSRSRRKTEDHNALAVNLAGLGVIVALAINSVTDNLAANRWYFNVIWSMIWYCYFCSRAGSSGEGSDNKTVTARTATSYQKSVPASIRLRARSADVS